MILYMGSGYSTYRKTQSTQATCTTRVLDVVADVKSEKDWKYDTYVGILSPTITLKANIPQLTPSRARSGACAVATLLAYISHSQFIPSADFIQYNSRLDKYGHLSNTDRISLRSILRAVKKYGACRHSTFNLGEFSENVVPGEVAYNEALNYNTCDYYKVLDDDLSEMRKCIATGFPVLFAIDLFDSTSYDSITNTLDFSQTSTDNVASGSCALVAVGYDDVSSLIQVKHFNNTWSESTYAYISYDDIKSHSHSMWVLTPDYDGEVDMF